MRQSIRGKLFWAFLITTLLVVIGMYTFMRWSLDRGFDELIKARQQERITVLSELLIDVYSEQSNWASLQGDKRRWIELLWQSDRRRHRPPHALVEQAGKEPADFWPPVLPEDQHTQRYTPFELRVMLLDGDRSILFGRAEARPHLSLTPLRYQGRTVAYLGLLPGKAINQPGELRFIEAQTQSFIAIALLMVLLSACLAFFLAFVLGKPLKRIAEAAKKLAVGRYDVRLPIDSRDELGRLARDVNELADALARSERSRQRWIADISHELRTPLAILHGELEALQDGIRPLTPAAIESLLGDVMRLNRLTNDLYQLTLSDQGALTYRKESLDPVGLLQDDIDALSTEFNEKAIRVERPEPSSKPVLMYADPDRLSQLFRNLLTNSLNYTDVGGCLKICWQLDKGRLILVFADSAPGVGDDDLPYLFDRFYRVDSSRSRHLGGAGLGLAICANIVQAHQGTMTAHSSPFGGLEIRIIFPLNP